MGFRRRRRRRHHSRFSSSSLHFYAMSRFHCVAFVLFAIASLFSRHNLGYADFKPWPKRIFNFQIQFVLLISKSSNRARERMVQSPENG